MKTKFYYLLLVLFPVFLQAQELKEEPLQVELGKLNARLKSERVRTSQLEMRVTQLELNTKALTDSLKSQVEANLAIQAQNERALNLALDEFSKKFEAQNKTMEDVQARLDAQWQQQLLYYSAALIVLVVLIFWAVRFSASRAIASHKSTWNEFQEHLLKKR